MSINKLHRLSNDRHGKRFRVPRVGWQKTSWILTIWGRMKEWLRTPGWCCGWRIRTTAPSATLFQGETLNLAFGEN